MTRTTPEQRADLARMLDAAMLDAGMSGPWREWGDMWIQLGTTRALIVAAVNALPDLLADLADAEAERDSLTEGVRAYGRTIDRWGKLIIEATGSEDITTPDGDGDWEVVEHRLSEVRAEQERLTVALRLAQARAADAETETRLLAAKVEAVRALHRAVGIYDECDCDDPDPATHLDVDEVGLTCNLMYRVCAECCRDDVCQTEGCANYHDHRLEEDYHCPTIRTLDGGESVGRCFSIRPRTDGGVVVANHHSGVAFMRDLDRDDALTLYHWLGDHLMRYSDGVDR